MSEPKADPAPKADPPKADPPKTDPPKADPPKADPPKVDASVETPKTFTQADLDRELARQKKEFDKAAAAEAAKAKLSEDEKKDAEIADLKLSIRMRDAKDSVIDALGKAGARGTELMWKAVKGDLEFDDKGKLANLDALVTDLKADYPDAFGEPKPTKTIDGGADSDGKGTTLTKEKLAKMTPAEIQQLDWDEVKKVMAGK